MYNKLALLVVVLGCVVFTKAETTIAISTNHPSSNIRLDAPDPILPAYLLFTRNEACSERYREYSLGWILRHHKLDLVQGYEFLAVVWFRDKPSGPWHPLGAPPFNSDVWPVYEQHFSASSSPYSWKDDAGDLNNLNFFAYGPARGVYVVEPYGRLYSLSDSFLVPGGLFLGKEINVFRLMEDFQHAPAGSFVTTEIHDHSIIDDPVALARRDLSGSAFFGEFADDPVGACYSDSTDSTSRIVRVAKTEYKIQLKTEGPARMMWAEMFTPTAPSEAPRYRFLSEDVPAGKNETTPRLINPLDATSPMRIGAESGNYDVRILDLRMAVDANRDGSIKFTSEDTSDATSKDNSFRFWINDDIAPQSGGMKYCDGISIFDASNLENFARLKIYLGGLQDAIIQGQIQVGLKWKNPDNTTPSIKVWRNMSPNGGTEYLTDADVAAQHLGLSGPGLVQGSTTYLIPKQFWVDVGLSASQPYGNLLFEGCSTGKGQLVISLCKADGTEIGEGPGVWLDLHGVEDFYEQASAANVPSGNPPSSLVSDYSITKTASSVAPDETKQVIVFVHGINNTYDDYVASSHTIFKRLYWAGYRGRFSAFRWPCAYLPYNTANPYQYNLGEFFAFKSAAGLKNYLGNLRGRPDLAGYAIDLYAHSQGNVVASEAVAEGATFDNYILTQGAIPAHCYDTSAPFLQKLLDADASTPTPLLPANGGYHGYFSGIHGNLVNFYNTEDYALAKGTTLGLQTNWEEDQRAQKPEAFIGGPSYIFSVDTQTTTAYYTFGSHNTVTDMQELKSMVARSRSRAVGAQDGLRGTISSSVDLFTRFKFGNTRPEHSAQFTRPIQTVLPYYRQILTSFQILP